MPWSTSTRRAQLPPNWDSIRTAVLNRDEHQCRTEENHARCPKRATEVDHIDDPHDHSMANLQSLCKGHHADKTTAEAHEAMRQLRAAGRHQTEAHPFTRRTTG